MFKRRQSIANSRIHNHMPFDNYIYSYVEEMLFSSLIEVEAGSKEN